MSSYFPFWYIRNWELYSSRNFPRFFFAGNNNGIKQFFSRPRLTPGRASQAFPSVCAGAPLAPPGDPFNPANSARMGRRHNPGQMLVVADTDGIRRRCIAVDVGRIRAANGEVRTIDSERNSVGSCRAPGEIAPRGAAEGRRGVVGARLRPWGAFSY